jgi:hypothetical protein
VVTGPDAAPITLAAELGTGTEGVQLTSFAEVGMSGVPRIHAVGDEMRLTWTDRSDTDAEAWLRGIDGAARWTGGRTRLVGASGETLYARTAVGSASIGVLHQAPGSPYVNRFQAVDADGTDLFGPVDLDPMDWSGSFGGDVEFDGSGYVLVWRSFYDVGVSEIRWMRVEEGTWDVTGPVTVAGAGEGTSTDIVGGFEPFSHVDVAVLGELSLVGFVRGRYDGLLDMALPKSQMALLDASGAIAWSAYAGPESDWTFHRECRVSAIDGTFVAVWSMTDLTDPDPAAPTLFRATRSDADGSLDPDRGQGTLVLDQVDDRDEPFLIGHPDHLGVLVWWDHRAYTLTPSEGRIELTAAPVSDDLTTGDEVVFHHGRVVAGVGHLDGALAGTNVLIVWIDQRHGSGITDPRPEVYFETVWL